MKPKSHAHGFAVFYVAHRVDVTFHHTFGRRSRTFIGVTPSSVGRLGAYAVKNITAQPVETVHDEVERRR